MSSRKKSTTSSDQSTSGSSSGSSSSSSSSGSETGSSVGSESDSSSSTDHGGKVNQHHSNARNQNANNNAKTSAAFRRKSAEVKPSNKPATEDKPKQDNTKTKSTVNRGQRLSKSSVYSSEEETSPIKKAVISKTANQTGGGGGNKRNFQYDNKKGGATATSVPQSGGGKAPPSVVKQQQQQSAAKTGPTKQQQPDNKNVPKNKTNVVASRPKNRSIFSPVNSSDSDEKKKIQGKIFPKANATATKTTKAPIKPKPKAVPVKKPIVPPASKKEERKRSVSSETATTTEEEEDSSTNTSSHTEESDSSSHSSPLAKKPIPASLRKSTNSSRQVNKSNEQSKTVILSDSDGIQSRRKQQTVRKLTRSSSTRKSKHLTGKPSDTDSEIELDKSRSISKSPVKKSTISNINVTKSKTKAKKSTDIPSLNSFVRSISPVLEPQKCPVEGCDSSGHLSGNHSKHFLPDACPIYHNMSMSECKDRTVERKQRDEEKSKIITQYETQNVNVVTPEQKIYLTKIRDARARFKPPPSQNLTANDKMKGKQILDKKREPNLVGLVPDYDFELFREAQAIASEKIEKELKDLPVETGIKYISMGKHQMKVWYQSPYPEDVAGVVKMYICEFCLRYKSSEISMKRHSTKCVWRHPPGDEIYRKDKLQVWQVDGKKYKQFCQLLCLLAKFFLDHKTLYYEVEPFLFYVMTLANYEGCHIVGYFSKEKNSFLNYNVSCILTLPPYQRKGYGRLLIDFSYLLTRVEGKIGSPEKPLSDLGLISYRSYWKDVLLDFLCTRTGTTLSIKDLSQEMAIYSYDIVSTLQALGMMKYWKGKHIVLKKQDVLEEYEERIKRRGNFPKIDASCLRWTPFIPPQTTGST